MIYTALTNRAMVIAYDAHHGQVDKQGIPYVFHPFHVAEQMTDELSTCVALLHDVVEDSDVTLNDLAQEFPTEVVEALALLTHDESVSYSEYIQALAGNELARAVKRADLEHNLDEARGAGTDESRGAGTGEARSVNMDAEASVVANTAELSEKMIRLRERYAKALLLLDDFE
ncbi:MAG: HD domain-containing protein [Eggerthellaceae bacterium]